MELLQTYALRLHGHQDVPLNMTAVPNYRTVLRDVTSCGLLPTLTEKGAKEEEEVKRTEI
jgi:hypothetical protein